MFILPRLHLRRRVLYGIALKSSGVARCFLNHDCPRVRTTAPLELKRHVKLECASETLVNAVVFILNDPRGRPPLRLFFCKLLMVLPFSRDHCRQPTPNRLSFALGTPDWRTHKTSASLTWTLMLSLLAAIAANARLPTIPATVRGVFRFRNSREMDFKAARHG